MLTFCLFHNENNSFFAFFLFELKITFSFVWFLLFFVVFERICFYFHFAHSDVRIKQIVSFPYRNELKIRPQKQIRFMHVVITIKETLCAQTFCMETVCRGDV
jgi:hypothetical protein